MREDDPLVSRAVEIIGDLRLRLKEAADEGRPLRVKAGFDPTRPDLHLGHSIVLRKLRQFQDAGHTVVLIIGDFTAMVGDPTGRSEERPRLTREEVLTAAATYQQQAFKILDARRTEVRHNSEWFDTMTLATSLDLMSKWTVARMLERSDFATRFKEEKAIHQHEFMYPLLQGYDSVVVRADVEIGGTDQLFNLNVGRDLQQKYGQRAQVVMTMPLLEGVDAKFENFRIVGRKMSKSLGNHIGLLDDPLTMFRRVMQLDDDVTFRYFDLLSSKSPEEIGALKTRRLEGGNPMPIKATLAEEIVSQYHSQEVAAQTAATFRRIYEDGDDPINVAEHTLPVGAAPSLWLPKALSLTGLVKSTNEGKRLVEAGGVAVDRVKTRDVNFQLNRGQRYLLRVGSKERRFAYVTPV